MLSILYNGTTVFVSVYVRMTLSTHDPKSRLVYVRGFGKGGETADIVYCRLDDDQSLNIECDSLHN